MVHSSLQQKIADLQLLFKKHKVKSAFVFGSALSDKFNENSDVDILVSMEDGLEPVDIGAHLWDLYYEAKELLNREVDILTDHSLKNPYFIEEVNRTKVAVYG